MHQFTLSRFCSSLTLWGTQRAQRFFRPRQSWRMRVGLLDEIMISCISAYAILVSFFMRDSALETFSGVTVVDVFWGSGRCHSTTTVIVFQRSRSRHELSEPPENSGFGRRLTTKTVFYTLKALLKRFSLAVVIIHHSSKISSRKVNTASVFQGRICSDSLTCCHTDIEFADQTFYHSHSQYTDTRPTSPSADPITPGAWQGSHLSANF